MTQVDTARKRDPAIDMLKLISTVAVVTIHLSGYGLYLYDIGSFGWLSCNFWDSLSRFAVPVFLMCTGALMLSPDRELPMRRLINDYLLRILWILLFWAFVYRIFNDFGQQILSGGSVSLSMLGDAVSKTLLFDHHNHLYYLQLLLLVYLVLPLMRSFVKNAEKQTLKYAVILWIVLGVVFPFLLMFPPFSNLGAFVQQYGLEMSWNAVGFVFFGYYMYTQRPNRDHFFRYMLCFVAGFLFVFLGTLFFSMHNGKVFAGFMDGMNIGPALMSCGLFGAVRSLSVGKTDSLTLKKLSASTFCIYLIHHFFIMIFRQLGFDVLLMPPVLGIPIEVVAALILSYVGWLVLSKIPFVKKYLISTGAKEK